VLMMLVNCATVALLIVLTWVLPVESVRRLATFLRLESPIISLLQTSEQLEWTEGRGLYLSGGYRILLANGVRRCRRMTGRGGRW